MTSENSQKFVGRTQRPGCFVEELTLLMEQRLFGHAADFVYCTFPVVSQGTWTHAKDKKKAVVEGTAFAIRYKGTLFLVSAKHVFCDPWTSNNYDGKKACLMNKANPQRLRSLDICEVPLPREHVVYPAEEVDLIAFDLKDVVSADFFLQNAPESCFFPEETLNQSLHSLSDVFLIGYPHGLFDYVNNLPILRKGVLSLPYQVNWRGDPQIGLFSAAAFPSDSGAPVLGRVSGGDFGAPVFAQVPGIERADVALLGVHCDGPDAEPGGESLCSAVGFFVKTKFVTAMLVHYLQMSSQK